MPQEYICIVDCGAATKVGEILPAPRNMDVAATVLAYFGDDVSQRKDIVGIPVGLIRNCGLNDAAQLVTLDAWRENEIGIQINLRTGRFGAGRAT